jgi:hypothetical protein
LWEEKQKNKIHSVGYNVKQEDIVQDEVVVRKAALRAIRAVEDDGPAEETQVEGVLEQANNTPEGKLNLSSLAGDVPSIFSGLLNDTGTSPSKNVSGQPPSTIEATSVLSTPLKASSTPQPTLVHSRPFTVGPTKPFFGSLATDVSSPRHISTLTKLKAPRTTDFSKAMSGKSKFPQSSFDWQPPALARNSLDRHVNNVFTGTASSSLVVTAAQLEALSAAAFAPVSGASRAAMITKPLPAPARSNLFSAGTTAPTQHIPSNPFSFLLHPAFDSYLEAEVSDDKPEDGYGYGYGDGDEDEVEVERAEIEVELENVLADESADEHSETDSKRDGPEDESNEESELEPITLETSTDAPISVAVMALVTVEEPQFEDDVNYGCASGYEYLLARESEDEVHSSEYEDDIFDSDVASNGTCMTSPTVSFASNTDFAFDESAEDYILETYNLSSRFTGFGENDEGNVVFGALDSTTDAPLVRQKPEYVSHGTQTNLPKHLSQGAQTISQYVSRGTQFSWADDLLESSTIHDMTAIIIDPVPQDDVSITEDIVDASSDATELGGPTYIAKIESDDLFVEDLGKKALQLKLSFEALETSTEWADFLVVINGLPEHPRWEFENTSSPDNSQMLKAEQKEQQTAPTGQATKVQYVACQPLNFSHITIIATEPTSAQDNTEPNSCTEDGKLRSSLIPTIVIEPASGHGNTGSNTSAKDTPETSSLAKKLHRGLSLPRNTYRSVRSPLYPRRSPTIQPTDPDTINMGTNEYGEPAPFEMSER